MPAARAAGSAPPCRTTLHGTHADVREVVPEGLSIGVDEMRALVQLAARHPATGRYQIVIIGDADRLTERAANALLKAVEEPSEQTVFLLCAPSDHPDDVPITIRSRCRVVSLHSPPAPRDRGRARAPRRDRPAPRPTGPRRSAAATSAAPATSPRDAEARARRERVLAVPLGLRGPGRRVRRRRRAGPRREGRGRRPERRAATPPSARSWPSRWARAGSARASPPPPAPPGPRRRAWRRQQRSRATRTQRDVLDLALIDLAGFFRDVLVAGSAAHGAADQPGPRRGRRTAPPGEWTPESALRRLEAVLACREALDRNVKPLVALEAMLVALQRG